jgi:hypothetical protein
MIFLGFLCFAYSVIPEYRYAVDRRHDLKIGLSEWKRMTQRNMEDKGL